MGELPNHTAKQVAIGSGVQVAEVENPRSETIATENNLAPSKLIIAGWEVIHAEEHQNTCGLNTDAKLLLKALSLKYYCQK